jgi:hypothetical protein
MSDRLLSPPIATATIAGLYLRQGLLDQAEALYLRLLEQRPGDAALKAGLAEARRRQLAKRPLTNDSKVSLEAEGEGLTCRWSISERGIAQANALLQGAGKITVRLVSFPLEEGRAGQEIILERARGEITLRPPRGALTVSAAVGLLDLEQDDRFVAIAHCDPLQLRRRAQNGPPTKC